MRTLEQELEVALRAETPRPSAAFTDRLDHAVAAGFPRTRRRWLSRRPLLPALAVAACVLVAVVIAASLGGGGGGSVTESGGSAASSGAKAAPAVEQSLAAPHTAPVPTTGVRRVERSALLTLAAPAAKLETVANEIVAVVDRHHGFVLQSSVSSGTGGSFELRVPAGALQGTLRDLSELADVRSRTQNTEDITAPYNSVADQLAQARALRLSLLGRLAHATTDTQAASLRSRIRLVSGQIRSLTARFEVLQRRARFATIDVTLVRERARHAAAATGIDRDLRSALHSLVVSLGIALRVLGVALPLALLAAAGWLGAALLRRRRREATLF
ncbi:MAG TPA: DUF4349 domain-containing protein [Thermoleophilaceae bacterium]|nr:DUF4349 domain-containing protein [Thermoleophilaceae bacterium]